MRQLVIAGALLSCVSFSQRANADAYVSVWGSSVEADDLFYSSSRTANGARARGALNKPDFAFGGAFGFASESGFEIEAEVSSRSQDMTTGVFQSSVLACVVMGTCPAPYAAYQGGLPGELKTASLMGNLRYNFTDGPWVPYVEVGLGYGFTSTSGGSAEFDEVIADVSGGLTYQAGVGLRYELTNHVGLFVAYRYVSMPEIEVDLFIPAETNYSYPAVSETVEIDFSSRNILAGLRLTF